MKKLSYSYNEYIEGIISHAGELWPDITSTSGLISRIIANWDEIRQNNGGKSSRVIVAIQESEERIIDEVRKLGEGGRDYDHA